MFVVDAPYSAPHCVLLHVCAQNLQVSHMLHCTIIDKCGNPHTCVAREACDEQADAVAAPGALVVVPSGHAVQ